MSSRLPSRVCCGSGTCVGKKAFDELSNTAQRRETIMGFVGVPLTTRGVRAGTSSFVHVSKRAKRFYNSGVVLRRAREVKMVSEDNGVAFADDLEGSKYRIGIVSSRWNADYTTPMVSKVRDTLQELGVSKDNIVEMQVPGSFELPMATRFMCAAQKVDAVICIGTLINGETDHYEYISSAVTSGLMDLQLTLSIPIVFGVLTCQTRKQAEERSIGDKAHSETWARTAVEMAALRASQLGGVSSGKKSVGFF